MVLIGVIQRKYYRVAWRAKLTKEYLQYLKAKGDTDETLEWVESRLKMFRGWLRSSTNRNKPVTADLVLEYLQYRRDCGRSEATIHGDFRAISASLRWCYNMGYVDRNVCDEIKLPPPPVCETEPYSPADVTKMITCIDKNGDDMKYRDIAVILFLYDTACRVSAMCNIKLNHLDMDNRRVKVVDKYKKSRWLSWGDRTHQALQQCIELDPRREYLFENRFKRKLTRSGVYQMVRRVCRNCGVEFRKVHLLRSAYSCEFLTRGGPERAWQLKLILGHADMQQIENVYARAVQEKLTLHAMRELSPADMLPLDN